MNIKWIGAILVLSASGGFGIHLAAGHRAGVQTITHLIRSLDYMECALQYQLTPLPLLCEQAGRSVSGKVRKVYLALSKELSTQNHEDVKSGMMQVLQNVEGLSAKEKQLFTLLGTSLGCFDLPGQVKGIQQTREECIQELTKMKTNQEARLRSYQTLGLCAGAALVILFI